MNTTTKPQPQHIGRKISRMRELLGVKQETLAAQLGITQQSISKLEQSESIDDDRLDQVAKALGVSGEAIKNFSEEKTIMNIQNNYDGTSQNQNIGQQTFINPIEKYMEAVDKLTAAMEENKRLYEELLKEKEERIKLLQSGR